MLNISVSFFNIIVQVRSNTCGKSFCPQKNE